MIDTSVPVLVVTGTVGVGKTAIAMTVSEILHDRGIRHGLLEVDWLGEVYPAPDLDDPYSTGFAMRNLAAIWPHYLEVGITRAIVTMTIENQQELDDLKAALPSADVTVVRLEASPRRAQTGSSVARSAPSSSTSFRRPDRWRSRWNASGSATSSSTTTIGARKTLLTRS